jgi:UDP-N-acetylmuramate--alanine ligase
VHATDITQEWGPAGALTSFDVWAGTEHLGRAQLALPGEYNVYNSLAAIAVARELEVSFEDIKAGLLEFSGVERRFQVRGRVGGVTVVDDYGHHPIEVKAVLKAAKDGWSGRVVAVFQPHRFTRTMDLFSDFLSAFNDADSLFITDIFAAGEEPIDGINSRALYESLKEHGHKDVTYVASLAEVAARVDASVMSGDMVITLGAGDVWKVGVELVELLKKRKSKGGLRIAGNDDKP